jgi:hypothetical protein
VLALVTVLLRKTHRASASCPLCRGPRNAGAVVPVLPSDNSALASSSPEFVGVIFL